MADLSNDFILFLRELSKNNNRDWFQEHKKRYENSVKIPFQNLVQELINRCRDIDPEINITPKDAIFRINRDIRFSKDKSPYKTHVGAIISPYGRKQKEYPGFYLHIGAGSMMIGGGAYFLPKENLLKIRTNIAKDLSRFEKLIKNKSFVSLFGEIKGEQHKRLPKEFKTIQEQQPLIANKQFYYMAEYPPETALRPDVTYFIFDHFKSSMPLNTFLREQ